MIPKKRAFGQSGTHSHLPRANDESFDSVSSSDQQPEGRLEAVSRATHKATIDAFMSFIRDGGRLPAEGFVTVQWKDCDPGPDGVRQIIGVGTIGSFVTSTSRYLPGAGLAKTEKPDDG